MPFGGSGRSDCCICPRFPAGMPLRSRFARSRPLSPRKGTEWLVVELFEFGEDDGGVGAVGDVFADVFVGDFSVFVDDEHGGCGYAVVVEVVDVVSLGDFFALGGVEEGEGGSGVGDHGSGALEIVHAEGENLGVLLLDARVVALQLDELPEADASEKASVEDEDDVPVVLEIGECYVGWAVRDRKREI